MQIFLRSMKKIILPISLSAIICAVFMSSVIAQTGTTNGLTTGGNAPTLPTGVNSCNSQMSCLAAIVTNTYGALQDLNNYLVSVGTMAASWLAPDNSTATSTMQASFNTLGTLITQNASTQTSLQQQIAADLFGQPLSSFSGSPPPVVAAMGNININDLSYPTLLGNPPIPNTSYNPYNYLKYASGFGLLHYVPPTSGLSKDDILRYNSYYQTIMAAESFNAYALSNQYADYQNGNSFTKTQLSLITQATAQSWIAQISSQDLGKVLRQLLMFNSQSYVLLSDLIQIEKQMLTAQAITNSLLIAINTSNESVMYNKAAGKRLG